MKRLLSFTVLMVIVMGGMVLATDTRVTTMGDVNTVVKDEANIFLFPSTINYYPKLFAAEIGEPSYYYYMKDGDEYDVYLTKIGAHFQFGEKSEQPWVLGAYFDQQAFMPDIVYDYIYDKDADEGEWGTNHRITLAYGREFNAMPFGAIFTYYNNSEKVDNDTLATPYREANHEYSLSRYEFTLGLSPMQKKLDVSAKVAMTTWTAKEYYNDDLGVLDHYKPKGNMDLAFRARYWMDPMGKYTLIPHFTFEHNKQGIEIYEVYDFEGGAQAKVYEEVAWKYTNIDLGMGLNYDASQNVLVVADMGIRLANWKDTYDYFGYDEDGSLDTTVKYEEKWPDKVLPYFRVGLDAEVLKWLNVRAGVRAEWWREKYEEAPSREYSRSMVWTQTFLGAGMHWGNFFIDMNIDPDFLSRGPYFISGSNTTSYYDEPYDLSSRISLKYLFD